MVPAVDSQWSARMAISVVGHVYDPARSFVAPGSLADDAVRIGDDVITSADDAFAHGFNYHPRIRARGLEDPVGHNYPYSFDDAILQTTPVRQVSPASGMGPLE